MTGGVRTAGIAVAGIVAAIVAVRAEESLHIVPAVRDSQVLVSVEVADGYADDVRDAISSGLRTTFSYDVELRMIVRGWVDRTIATAVIGTTDQYDNLTRRHRLVRTVDGRVAESLVTEDEAVVKQWLTTLTRLPLCADLETGRQPRVLRTDQRPRAAQDIPAGVDHRGGWADEVYVRSVGPRADAGAITGENCPAGM